MFDGLLSYRVHPTGGPFQKWYLLHRRNLSPRPVCWGGLLMLVCSLQTWMRMQARDVSALFLSLWSMQSFLGEENTLDNLSKDQYCLGKQQQPFVIEWEPHENAECKPLDSAGGNVKPSKSPAAGPLTSWQRAHQGISRLCWQAAFHDKSIGLSFCSQWNITKGFGWILRHVKPETSTFSFASFFPSVKWEPVPLKQELLFFLYFLFILKAKGAFSFLHVNSGQAHPAAVCHWQRNVSI